MGPAALGLLCVLWLRVFPLAVSKSYSKRVASLDADFIIGGLFPVHIGESNASKCLLSADPRYQQFSESGDCYKINLSGVMWVEAMLYAIQEINNSSEILPGKTLGFDIRDSANTVAFAINASLDFVLDNRMLRTASGSNCSCSGRPVRAIIGDAGSKISKAVGYIVGVEDIPQISYSSTSPSLSDKTKFASFLRTIPPDYVQAQVMVDLVSFFNWTYVSAVATDEDYGRLGIAAFKQQAKARGVCISVDELFHPDNRLPETKAQIKAIVQKVKEDGRAKVVVLFCERPNAVAVLKEAERQGLSGVTWIGTESWGDKVDILPFKDSTVGGMLGVLPWKGNISKFEDHMATRTPLNTRHNPWFAEYWQGKYGCRASNATKGTSCSGTTALPTAASFHVNKAANVMDAVYAVALALERQLNCTARVSCNSSSNSLLSYVKSLTFTRNLGYPVHFDQHGDTKGNYLIKSLQRDSSSPHGKRFTTLGHWDWASSQLHLTLGPSHLWNGWTGQAPVSRCSAPCPRGEYTVRGSLPCCWTCVPCATGSYTNTAGQDECQPCMRGFTSSADRTECVELPRHYLHWNSLPALVIVSACGLGVAVTVFVMGVFLKYRNTAVVKASTREYSLLMLFILVCLFCLPLLFIDRPTDATCKVQPVCFGFLLTFWTSLMLTKTNRLLMIFKQKGILKYNLLSTRTQFTIAVLLTLVVVVIITVWMSKFPPRVHFDHHDSYVTVHCGDKSSVLLMITLAYTAVLATTSTYFAYKARKLPENFNETRLIGFSMFTFCVIWLIFVPCYYGSQQTNRTMFLCCSLLATSFSALFCMFSTRMRTILFHPERNKTQLVRASMFDYTVRRRTDSLTAMQLRRTSVVTVGTLSVWSTAGRSENHVTCAQAHNVK